MQMIDRAKQLWDWVDRRCEELGILSIRELERRSGSAYGTISRTKANLSIPTFDLSVKMSNALNVDLAEFWQHTGLSSIREIKIGAEADILRLLEGKGEDFKKKVAKIIEIMVELNQ